MSATSTSTTSDHLDDVFEKVGTFNRWQIIIQSATAYLCIVICHNNVLSFFTGDNPSWKCTGDINSAFCARYYNESILNGDIRYGQRCQLNRTEWMFNTKRDYSFVTEFDLVCDRSWLASLVSSSFYLGGVLGCSFSGIAADTFGRTPILLIAILATTVSLIASSFITHIWQLIILNVLRGTGAYVTYMGCNVYQSEFAAPKFRATSTSILLVGFSVSLFLIDLFAYYTTGWRTLSLYLALPCVPAIVAFCFLPESPRWLAVNGKPEKAMRIIEKFFKVECKLPNNDDYIICRSSPDQRKYTLFDLFRNPKVLKITLAISSIWFVMPIVYYISVFESSALGGNMYVAFALSNISDLVAYVICAVLCNRIGRKKTILGTFFICGVFIASLIIIRLFLSSSRFNINMIVISAARLACATAFCGTFVWTPELFPTILRSRGYFFCAVCDRLGVVTVPFLTGVLQDMNPIAPYAVACGLVLCGCCFGMSLPETRNQATRETYEDFFRVKPVEGICNDGVDGLEEQIRVESVE